MAHCLNPDNSKYDHTINIQYYQGTSMPNIKPFALEIIVVCSIIHSDSVG